VLFSENTVLISNDESKYPVIITFDGHKAVNVMSLLIQRYSGYIFVIKYTALQHKTILK